MEWKHYKMDELIEEISMGPFGSDVKKEFYVDNGVPILNGSNLQGFKLQEDSFGYLTKEKADSLKKCNAHRGDIIVTHRGTLGQIVYVPVDSKYDRYVISQSQFRFRCKADLVDVQYLVYYFHTREGQYKILANASQVGVPALARATSTFRLIDIKLPPLDDQRRIASILSSLDRKIELNNKINADLEEMAQAIFKNWFVDFEPFKDGKFVDSELGMIPEGWKVGTLGDITKNKSAKVKERNDVKVLSPVTTGELVLSEEYFTKQVFSSSIAKYKIVNKGNFAYNPARVNIGSLGRNEFDFDGCVSPVYVVFSVLDGYENYFDLFRKTDFFKDSVASLAIGGVRQSLSYDDLSSIEVIIPSENAVEEFNNLYNQMKKTIKANKLENSRLSLLRDTLLPRLMSGELEVPE